MSEVSTQTLHVVARELNVELNDARLALELFGEQQDQTEVLVKCREHLRQVRGALRLVEVFGAALLVEEMEQLAQYLVDNIAEQRHLAEGLDALMRAMVQLPTYLERVIGGGRDMALILLPLLNDLRAVRGHALLSEGTLLLLNLSSDKQANPVDLSGGDSSLTVAHWSRKMRTRFQLGLLGWIKGERIDQNLEIMARAAEKLEQTATTQAVFQLWWVVGAVIEALRDKGLEGTASVKRLLGQADRQMKRLYEMGEQHYCQQPPLDLLNNLLYYVARSSSNSARVMAVRASFRLSELLPLDEQVEAARDSLSAPSIKLMNTVAAAIKEDLARVKDALDLFVRKEGSQLQELAPQLELLRKIGDTLGVLGLGELRESVQSQTIALQAQLHNNTVPDEASLMSMAAALIKVEDSLDAQLIGLIMPIKVDAGSNAEQQLVAGADEGEFRQVSAAVLRECIVNMARIKEAIGQALERPGEVQALDQVPHLIRGITAGLLMLGRTRAVEVTERIRVALARYARPDSLPQMSEKMDRLADAIVAVEYYLETLQAGRSDPWYMLDNAETCLRALDALSTGTTVLTRVPQVATTTPVEQTVAIGLPIGYSNGAPPDTERTVILRDAGVSRESEFELPPVLVRPEDQPDPELLELFIEEARDEVLRLQNLLPRWDANPLDQEALIGLRRSFHTLKGSGRLVGALLIGEFAWSMEGVLNRVINQTLDRTPEIMDLLHSAMQVLPELVEQLEVGRVPTQNVASLIMQAHALGQTHAASHAAATVAQVEPHGEAAEQRSAAPLVAAAVSMDPALHDIFAKEVAGHLGAIRDYSVNCMELLAPYPVTESLYRACHTLNGASKTAGARHGIKIAEPLNHYISKLFDNGIPLPAEGLQVLRDSVSAIEYIVANLNENTVFFSSQSDIAARLDQLEQQLDALLAQRQRANGDATSEQPILPTLFASTAELADDAKYGSVDAGSAEQWVELSFADLNDLVDQHNVGVSDGQQLFIDETMQDAVIESASPPPMDEEPQTIVETAAWAANFAAPVLEESNVVKREPVTALRPPAAAERTAVETQMDQHDDAFDADVAAIFTEEAAELLEAADHSLQAWQADRHEQKNVSELKRTLHTLKGGARMAGIRSMGDLSHELETFMELIEHGTVPADGRVFSVLQRSLDELARMRDMVNQGRHAPRAQHLIDSLQALGRGEASVEVAPLPVLAAEQIVDLPQQESADDLLFAEVEALLTEDPVMQVDIESEFGRDDLPLGAYVPQIVPPAEATLDYQLADPIPVQELVLPEAPIIDSDLTDTDLAVGIAGVAKNDPLTLSSAVSEPLVLEVDQQVLTALPPGRAPAPQERGEMARVDAELLDHLLNSAGEVSILRSRLEQQVSSLDFNLSELGRTVTRLKDQLRQLEIETEAQILHKHQDDSPSRDDFDPLELDRYSTIQQYSRALAESVSDVDSIEGLLETMTSEAQNLLLQQARVVTELQNGLMKTRMVPFSRHAQRLTRLVRQVANETGKQVELNISGAGGELDRQVLERMLPPFEHMLRNSVVHGIELPTERRQRGKPEAGAINVGLHREGAEMVITLQDDGRGIDVDAVRDKARAKGLIAGERVLTDEEALQLIMEPGFSTATEVTQHAGRGVGMDVVVTEIKKLGGALFTENRAGEGVKFTIRLPFTLAISQSLLVRVGENEVYALPLPTVESVVRLPRADVIFHLSHDAPSFDYGGQLYKVQHLGAFIDAGLSVLPEAADVPLVLIKAGEHSAALLTDELIGNREIVVKSVGPQVSSIRGIFGATILGDGRVVIILDMGALIRSEWRARPASELVARGEDRRTVVLVVDDSITVRRVTQRLLERQGMRVLTAKDGVDALEILQEHLPDVILLDIEMPRMDGYEMATQVRGDRRLMNIPIIMITSRVSEKHRARAIEIGVNDYLGKPYQEAQLLDAIEALVASRRRDQVVN
jgi:chemosensory pili system protein ChpA (sensor histidine kinase/response regulator)